MRHSSETGQLLLCLGINPVSLSDQQLSELKTSFAEFCRSTILSKPLTWIAETLPGSATQPQVVYPPCTLVGVLLRCYDNVSLPEAGSAPLEVYIHLTVLLFNR